MDYSEFCEPKREYAIYPIIHGGVADKSRTEALWKQGFAGVVGNVPYGDGFPDDAEEWKRTAEGFREYLGRGMQAWIYDESGYPSGTARATVTQRHPEFIAKGLYCYDYWRPISGPGGYRADVPGDRLWKALLLPKDGGDPLDVTSSLTDGGFLKIDVPAGEWFLFTMSVRRLFDGTHATESYSEPRNYISLSDKAATEEFISVTHEKYAAALGSDLQNGIRAFFTDEPSLISWNIRNGVFPMLPWLDSYPADFEARYGYPLYLAAVAVVTGRGLNKISRRCDFWEFIADTVSESYFGTIQNWCHAHGTKASGHMLEEERLEAHVFCYGSMYACARRFDWPGIDMLTTSPKRLDNEDGIPIAQFISSAARIFGDGEAFTEFSDHCEHSDGMLVPKEWYRASVCWHLAMGINNFTSYYSFDGFTDGDKRELNAFTARCGAMIRKGRRACRTAVFYPEASMWAAYTPGTDARGYDRSEENVALSKSFVAASWSLIHAHVDFDYIDARLVDDAELLNGRLCFNGCAYEAVVLPRCKVLQERTAEKLLEFASHGGRLVFADTLPSISRESGEAAGFRRGFAGCVAASGELVPSAEVGKLECLPRSVAVSGGAELLTHTRECGGEELVFVANMGASAAKAELRPEKKYAKAELLDPRDGSITPLAAPNITVPPYSGVFVVFSEK